ncbi:MAG: phosphonopyruvate decarboxylase [Methanoregula sp.]|nr:phosphonopyruvate decarboxylase [Methanoregula sp.]
MIESDDFIGVLADQGIDFFCGVSDSLLQDFCACLEDSCKKNRHIITANEGNAVALASGHYLATGCPGQVYMQNSGLGNAVNPLLSLADAGVYGIPVLLLIGWRGEPGTADEPQHTAQGRITLELLQTLGIPYRILPSDSTGMRECVDQACEYMKTHRGPFALVVRKNTFCCYVSRAVSDKDREVPGFTREKAIKIIMDQMGPEDVVVSTTGKASRELFEYMKSLAGKRPGFLPVVGSMGHASSIALGIALEHNDRTVFCIDGDGSIIMHMGSLGIIGHASPKNFVHIVMNNGAHESVGGQPTVGFFIGLADIAKASGYPNVARVASEGELKCQLEALRNLDGPVFLEIRICTGSRENLGRPDRSLMEIKKEFMEFLQQQ